METARSTGSYYTSPQIARYMVAWAVRTDTDSLLEPSFGDGTFLDAAFARFAGLGCAAPPVTGVEVQPEVFQKYAASAPKSFHGRCGDFLAYAPERPVSAVVGNPPYVSLRNLAEAERVRAAERMAAHGIRIHSGGSLWMPFTVHGAGMLEQGGRLAFVLPFEVTYVKYAYPLWEYLGGHFGSLRVVRVHEDFFPGVAVEAVLLFADRYGESTQQVAFETYGSVDALLEGIGTAKSSIRISDIVQRKKPFAAAMLSGEQREMLGVLRKKKTIVPLAELCKFSIGYVCADKAYFHPDEAVCQKLPDESLIPCINSGRALSEDGGTGAAVRSGQQTSRLFCPGTVTAADRRYIEYGEEQGVHLRFKCRQRDPWYVTPSVDIPDLILTVFGDAPKLVVNEGRYAVSNSLLAGRVKAGLTPEQLVCMWYNSLTLLSIELNVHSLGGGVLILIPGETDRLEVVNAVTPEQAGEIFPQLDRCIREWGAEAAYRLGDALVLSKLCGLSEEEIRQIRDAVSTLRSWRMPEGRRRVKKR